MAIDLDAIQALAEAADQGAYEAKDVTDLFLDGPWDDENDQPASLWWVNRPGWIDNDEAEVMAYSEADAHYAEAMHPKVSLALVAELRAARRLVGAVHAHLVACAPHDLQLESALAAYDKVAGEVRDDG